MLEHVDGVREAAESGDALFGTTDSWLLWNLTGGSDGGRHITDVTNASRTMLMDLENLDWDEELLGFSACPAPMLPRDRAVLDAEAFGTTRADGPFGGEVRIGGASVTSMPRWSARSAWRRARPRTPTAPATSCC